MNSTIYRTLLYIIAIGFAGIFVVTVMPPFVRNPDLAGAVMAGFVNPYASAFALDAICCWAVLALWVLYEATAKGIRHGWIALLLGMVLVPSGFAAYLLIRHHQLEEGAG